MSVRATTIGDGLSHAGPTSATNYTTCGWFRAQAAPLSSSSITPLITVSGNAWADLHTLLYEAGSGGSFAAWGNSIGGVQAGGDFAQQPAVGTWFFVWMRCAGTGAGQLEFGIAQYGASFEKASMTGNTFTISSIEFSRIAFTYGFNGDLAHPRLWNAVLTDAELYAEMYSSLPVRLADIVFAWRDISTSSVTDLSTNAASATIQGTLALATDPPIDDLLHVGRSMDVIAATGINFRATSGYVVDGATETYCLSESYPRTRRSRTFGWDALDDIARDRNNAIDARLAGLHQHTNDGTFKNFRIDITPGTYLVRLALGDASNGQADEYAQIFDNVTQKLVIDGTAGTDVEQFFDASGVLRTSAANWVSANQGVLVTFASSICIVRIGTLAAGTNSTTIAHLSLTPAAVIDHRHKTHGPQGFQRTLVTM